MGQERNVVPCNGCTAFCRHERIILSEEHGDDHTQYYAIPTRKGLDGPLEWMLAHKRNGDCIYLGKDGCTIHERAPWVCRQFDCRKWFLSFPEAMQELLLPDDLDGEVVKAARARL
jgi:Fe-S-cluster containining protein